MKPFIDDDSVYELDIFELINVYRFYLKFQLRTVECSRSRDLRELTAGRAKESGEDAEKCIALSRLCYRDRDKWLDD